jgi:hypothetical protein
MGARPGLFSMGRLRRAVCWKCAAGSSATTSAVAARLGVAWALLRRPSCGCALTIRAAGFLRTSTARDVLALPSTRVDAGSQSFPMHRRLATRRCVERAGWVSDAGPVACGGVVAVALLERQEVGLLSPLGGGLALHQRPGSMNRPGHLP